MTERGRGDVMYDRMMPGPMMGFGMWLLWALLLLALLAVAVAGLVWLIRSLPSGASSSDARRILDQRYASGELSREEYLQRRRDIEG
ncbi:MAG: SHOCT domain-containing protein [Nitriliruptorales bacterium]